jgi:hypothetical protein
MAIIALTGTSGPISHSATAPLTITARPVVTASLSTTAFDFGNNLVNNTLTQTVVPTGVVVTDLSGNVLWTYSDPGNPALNIINGVKMLPDGNLLMAIGQGVPATEPIPTGTINEIREVNLAGDTVRRISIDDLNSELAAANCAECRVTLTTFHHDVEPLPNGHWLALANTRMALSATSTPALTAAPATTVLGDVLVDLDQNMQPVWVWNEFNHLDPNRHPIGLSDWTHTNAVTYSKDDGNLVVSMRNQNWIVKVRYTDGTGDGSVLWRLGGRRRLLPQRRNGSNRLAICPA